MNLAVLFSGGKDSNFVTYLAKQNNHKISCLITLESKNPNSYMFQSVGNNLIELQAKAMGIPLLKIQTTGEKETELQDLQKALEIAKEKYNIDAVASGAIKSAYQSQRIQKIAKNLNLWCYNPIWQINEDEYMDLLINNGFQIKIFGIFSYPFEKNILNKTINEQFLQKLKQLRQDYQISIAGEGGEYESFILDGPNYKQKIEIENIQTNMDSENSGIITNCDAKLVNKEKENQPTTQNKQSQTKSNSEENSEILIINLNRKNNKLYELEYIKPIYQILEQENKTYQIINYKDLTEKLIQQYNKIILSGTPLKEFEYLNHLERFNWIKQEKNKNKKILGICAGCQIIQKIHNGKERNIEEIGLQNPEIIKQDKILNNESLKEIYALHSTSFQTPNEFQTIAKTKNCDQIIKHKEKNIYGTLFHPEIRNHQIIINFVNNL